MTHLSLPTPAVDTQRLAPGTLLLSKLPLTDDGPDGEERITPAGSVWCIEKPMSRDGDYEIVCDQTGGWLYTMANELLDHFHVLPPRFLPLMASLARAFVEPDEEALLTSLFQQLDAPANAIDSLDDRTTRFETVLKLYALLRGDATLDVPSTLSDFLCDAMHFAAVDDHDFLHAVEVAEENYCAETHPDVEH